MVGQMNPDRLRSPQKMKGVGDVGDAMAPKVPTGAPQPPKLTTGPTAGQPEARPTPTGDIAPTGNGLLRSRVQRPAPVAYGREGEAIPGVSGRLHDLTSRTSPYIQRARTRAEQSMNRRGLRSSSIAAGAGEAAAIDAALPIAQADAGIAAGERGMRHTEYMQEQGFIHDKEVRAAQRAHETLLQEREHEVQQLMQQRGFTHERAVQETEHKFRHRLQAAAHAHAAAQAEAQRKFAGRQADLDRKAADLRQQRGLDHETAQAEASRELKKDMAVAGAVERADHAHRTTVDQAVNNPDVDEDVAAQIAMDSATAAENTKQTVAAVYDVELPPPAEPPPEAEGEG